MPARLAQQDDENGDFHQNSFDSTFDLCRSDHTCSADPQQRSVLCRVCGI
jgi:hypothetical protein